MKKIIKIFSVIVCISLILCGCTDDNISFENATVKAIIYGNHQNANIVSKDSLSVEINDIYENFGNMAFIVSDGTPEIEHDGESLLGSRSLDELKQSYKDRSNNPSLWSGKGKDDFVKNIEAKLDLIKADSEEVDLLEAIFEAVSAINMLNVYDSVTKKEIIIYDPGISTKGSVAFTDEFFEYSNKEIEEYIDDLEGDKLLPDLDDISIRWYGIGEVASPQEEINRGKIALIKDFWKKLIEECGGSVEFKDADFIDESNSEYKVTVVHIPEPAPVSDETFKVSFKSDSEDYSNSKKAANTIKKAAKEIKSSDGKWYVIGCEAGRTKDGINELDSHVSAKRAKKVSQELRAMGVSDEQIVAVALGPYNPWHIEDYDEDETWKDDKAKENRKVVIIHTENKSIERNIEFIEKGILKS
ncbi:MAG: hypothetical protein NC213_05020 [Acetobacter sp.]|nr:hypothetical protein [Bacteroides sp.]MCM1341087.1 hypothetical protein [Acetobacter sp.]MCM1433580.1 hypothetical protein [Clostridiales bacterium]